MASPRTDGFRSLPRQERTQQSRISTWPLAILLIHFLCLFTVVMSPQTPLPLRRGRMLPGRQRSIPTVLPLAPSHFLAELCRSARHAPAFLRRAYRCPPEARLSRRLSSARVLLFLPGNIRSPLQRQMVSSLFPQQHY